MPGQSKGAGDQAQIASKQRISQGKGHEPSCCASQGLAGRSCAALPCLYICPVKNVLGRVPMIPCFVAGNTHPTIPHGFARSGRAVLGAGAADTRPDSGNGSRLYELNLWMWRYHDGRGQARKVSVAKAMEARVKRLRKARKRAGETVKRRRTASASRAAGREAAARD